MPDPTSNPWQAADKAYQSHHINCPQCIAAGINRSSQERCPAGQELWDTYNRAGYPPHFTWLPAPAPLRTHSRH